MVNCKTLHEAIILVLESNNNLPMSFDEIAEEIKSQNLWKRKKDNEAPNRSKLRGIKLEYI